MFPCQDTPLVKETDKAPCSGVMWREQSTNSAVMIRAWWSWLPAAIPAIDLAKSNLIVIDLDRRPDGPDGVNHFRELARAHGDALDNMPVVATSSGGFHVYYRQPPGLALGNAEGALKGKGINVRGKGGYVIAPGALRSDGRGWRPESKTPDLVTAFAASNIPPLPDWLRNLITAERVPIAFAQRSETSRTPPSAKERAYAARALEDEARKVSETPQGMRNNTLNASAFVVGTLIPHYGLSREEAETALTAAALAAGLEREEIAKALKSGLDSGMKNPRSPLPALETRAGVRDFIEQGKKRFESRAQGAHAPDRWDSPDLFLLGTGRRPAPPFPLDLLPRYWSAWVQRRAAGASAPADYVATSLLACTGAMIANVRWPLAGANWSEPPILWCGIVGSPSSSKSPAMDACFDLVRHAEDGMAAGFDDERRRYETQKQAARARREAWEIEIKAAIKAGNNPPSLPEDAVPPNEPVRPRVRVADFTIEKLGALAAGLPRGLLVVRDELAGWLGGFDRYGSAGSDRAFMIEMYGGRSYVVDRVKNPEALRIPHLSVGVLGAVQQQKAFIEGYEKLLNSLGDDEAVLFADAVHPTHAARPVGCWAPSQEKLAIEQTSGRQRINIHGAIDLETGQTRMIEALTIDAASTIRLLQSIEALYPMLALIHVFLDNARYHHAKLVQEWLALPGRRIKLHFIPTYCPHLNPIERLWGLMHRNVTHNKCYATCAQFADATLSFLREKVPGNWADLCDSVTDNFRIINPKDFRVMT